MDIPTAELGESIPAAGGVAVLKSLVISLATIPSQRESARVGYALASH